MRCNCHENAEPMTTHCDCGGVLARTCTLCGGGMALRDHDARCECGESPDPIVRAKPAQLEWSAPTPDDCARQSAFTRGGLELTIERARTWDATDAGFRWAIWTPGSCGKRLASGIAQSADAARIAAECSPFARIAA